MTKTVLILGASGKIGTHAARAFSAAGWQVRRYDRKAGNMTDAARGCDVIVNGLNPPNYHDWANLIPRITAEVQAAARVSGATVIVPGNVYHFGNTPGEWSETTPPRPCSRKGKIRLDMERSYRESGVKTIILRAGNFIDPDQNGDVMSLMVLSRIGRGKLVAPGDAGNIQPYAFLPDWAEAARHLADKADELDMFTDIPFPGHAFTLDQLRETLETELERKIKVTGFPWWVMRMAAPFWELARELVEMRYLWDTPHTLSSGRFDALLPGFRATPLREVMLAGLPADIHPDKAVTAGGLGHGVA